MRSKKFQKKYKFIRKLYPNLPIQTHDFERVLNFQKNYKSHVKFLFIFHWLRDYFWKNYQSRLKNTKIYQKKLSKKELLSALKFEKVADKKARFECNDILKCKKKGKCLKSHLLYVKKVKKGLDHNAQFELKIAQVYVFQGKKKQNQT